MTDWRMPETTDWARKCNLRESALVYGRSVHEVALRHPYARALEVGAAWGISTMAILTAQDSGHLTSVDLNEQVQAVGEVAANNLQARWTFRAMDSRDFWRENRETFDFIFIDGNHSHAFARIDIFQGWRCLAPGGVLLIDDVLHPANVDPGASTEGYLYGVAVAAWQLIAAEGLTAVNTCGRIVYLVKPDALP